VKDRFRPFDEAGSFRPTVTEDRLREAAVRGAGATVLSGGLTLAIQFVGTIVLARLLTPKDFGVVAVVTTFSLILANFGLNGFTEAVLQREEMNHDLASNLFWITVGAGLLLTVGFGSAGSLLAWFYREPLAKPVSGGLSLTILFNSLSVLHLALLRRAMRFSAVSFLDVLAKMGSLAGSIVAAWLGWGYWALVAGAVLLPFAQMTGGWYLCRWLPGLPKRVRGTAAMVRFALNVYGCFGVNYCSRNLDNFLVGWRLGAPALGFYKRAYDLFALTAGQLSGALTNVAVSALSRFNPRSAEYRETLTGAVSIIAFVGMGLSGVFTLLGRDLIRLLFGPRWAPTGEIFTYFGPGVGIVTVYYISGWIHLSIGRPGRWFRWNLVEITVMCVAFLVALHWGPTGMALAWTTSFWLLTIPGFWYAGVPINLGMRPLLNAAWRYVAAALLAVAGSRWVFHVLQPFAEALVARIAILSALFGALYIPILILLHGGYTPLRQLMKFLGAMFPRSGPANSGHGGPVDKETHAIAEASVETPFP
jgi:PST family polysaccharide transporter